MSTNNPHSRRVFAVIPAAGESRRMGCAKLLLPLDGRTVLARLLDALDLPEVAARVVVVRPGDEPLRNEAEAAGAMVVVPDAPPPDMRASVQHALDAITEKFAPTADDAWLLVPADHPVLDRSIVETELAYWRSSDAPILVPTFRGKSGHPTIFRWSLAQQVPMIPADRGLDWLREQHSAALERIDIASDTILCDLDTPEDYERLRKRFE